MRNVGGVLDGQIDAINLIGDEMTAGLSKRLIVVGNGATAVDASGRFCANRHTVKFLTDLAERGYQVQYLEPHVPRCPHGNLQDAEIPSHLVKAVPVMKYRPFALWRFIQAIWCADLVYIFYPGTVPSLVAGLCRWLGIPYAIYLRGERFSDEGADAANLRGARFICCVGGLETRVQGLNSNIIPIQPMLDLSIADARRRDFLARNDSPWKLLFVGRLEADKGVPELVRAAELLHEQGFRFKLTLVGGGPLYGELAACFDDRSDIPVKVAGIVDNKFALHQMFEAADIFVLPTHHEGFPRVLYEAMMKSNMILTTFVGGIPGVLRDGHDAMQLPVGDAEGIAGVILAAAGNRLRMQALADNGHATVQRILHTRLTHLNAVLEQLNG